MSAKISIPTLIDRFSDLLDPRIDRCKRHRSIDIVVIGLCAVICGAEGHTEMETFGKVKNEWLKRFLELPHGIPSHDIFGRVLSVIEPREFKVTVDALYTQKTIAAQIREQKSDYAPT